MSWFRMHAEFVDDPKVQRLPPEIFRFWVNCLGLTCQFNGSLPSVADIVWKLKIPESKVLTGITALISAGLLDQQGESLAPHNWAGRQFKSDLSTDRVKRFRNGKKPFHETEIFVSETASETDQSRTDTDTDTEPPKPPAPDGAKEALLRIAGEIQSRHPKIHRDLGLEGVYAKLVAIMNHKKVRKPNWAAEGEKINQNHHAACNSYDWSKEDGQYAKGLANWLAPTMGRYELSYTASETEHPKQSGMNMNRHDLYES